MPFGYMTIVQCNSTVLFLTPRSQKLVFAPRAFYLISKQMCQHLHSKKLQCHVLWRTLLSKVQLFMLYCFSIACCMIHHSFLGGFWFRHAVTFTEGSFCILSTPLFAVSYPYVIQFLLESWSCLNRMFPTCSPPTHSPVPTLRPVRHPEYGLLLLQLSPTYLCIYSVHTLPQTALTFLMTTQTCYVLTSQAFKPCSDTKL